MTEHQNYKLLLPNVNPIFKELIFKASVNEDTEIPLTIRKLEDGSLEMFVGKDFVTLRVNAFLKLSITDYILKENLTLGIMSSNLFRKYLDLYTKDFSLLYKENQLIDKLIIYSEDLKISEILLSDLVTQSDKLIDLSKDMILNLVLTKDHIDTLKGFGKVVKSNICYVGFNKKDDDKYNVKFVIGEQKDYRFEYPVGVMENDRLNVLLENSQFVMRNHDGMEFCLKYQKKNLLSVLDVLSGSENSDIVFKLNFKGAAVIIEEIKGDGYELSSRFGLIPIT